MPAPLWHRFWIDANTWYTSHCGAPWHFVTQTPSTLASKIADPSRWVRTYTRGAMLVDLTLWLRRWGWGEPDSEHDRHATPTFFFSQFPRMIGWTVSKHRICPPPLPQHYSLNRRGIRYCEMKEQMKGRAGGEGKYWRKTRNAKEGIKRKKKPMKEAKGK